MMTNLKPDFLRVKGSEIVNGHGEVVCLRGFCLGGWLNLENFIIGYPAHESGMRAAVTRVLGEAMAHFFFERFLHYFITEDDLRFIKSLGCNVVRLPLNYRHFESDNRPFEYKPEGFALLDQVIGWARTQHIYVILDLHAIQGWQNQGWHCDNPCRKSHFWGQKVFEDRAVALWEELARRYRDEAFVAGYNVMNEPAASETLWLNHFYRRVTAAIRAIDPGHILFLEGNHYSQQFEQLEPPFDSNVVYSSHNYVVPGLDNAEYPGIFNSEVYDRERLEREYLERARFTRQHGVPNLVGEFGCIYSSRALEASRLRVMADMIDIIEKCGHHWTIWTYKDIGKMGLVYTDPESQWMRRTQPVREIKTALRCDYWIERHESEIDRLIQQIVAHASTIVAGQPGDWTHLSDNLSGAINEGVLSQMLQPAFAEQFRVMSEKDIDQMMQSFAFQNCVQRAGLVQLLRSRG
jgi:endoglucanase